MKVNKANKLSQLKFYSNDDHLTENFPSPQLSLNNFAPSPTPSDPTNKARKYTKKKFHYSKFQEYSFNKLAQSESKSLKSSTTLN